MATHLTNSTKAFLFFIIAFGLTVTVSLLYPLLGGITAIIHMVTPVLSVLIMMLAVTREGYSKTGWATLGLHRAGLRWWLLALIGPLVVRALLLSGLLHAIWHLPLMVLTPFIPVHGNWLMMVPVFLVTLTAAGVFYGYLRLRSKSVWPVTLAHGAINWFFPLFAALTVTASPLALAYLAGEMGVLTLIATVVGAGWLLYRRMPVLTPGKNMR